MYLPYQKKLAALVILAAAVAANSMTIPIVKGNTWSYSYRNDTNSSHIAEGKLIFFVDSVKVVADTSFFSLSYFDSGCLYHVDTIQQFVKTYHIKYLLFHDTVTAIDSIFSPGYNKLLLSFIIPRDTSYSWGSIGGGGDYEQKTDTYAINVMNMRLTLFDSKINTTYHLMNQHFGTFQDAHDEFSWIPEIGMTFFACNDSISGYPSFYSSYINSYSLLSFNNTPIASLSQLSVKSTKTCHPTRFSTGSSQKILVLSGRNTKSGYLDLKGSGYYSLRGQKMGIPNRSQLIIYRR